MSTITMDFRHRYQRGERREAEQVAYQWDLGHVAEIFVPLDATYNISYCFSDYDKTDDYAIESITAADDGGYKLTAHVPNRYFERSGELRVYIIGEADGHIITTYEGFITIRGRLMPDDYVDDDPENGATSIVELAREYATKSESFAVGGTGTRLGEDTDNAKYYLEQAEAVAESIPEDYSELSDDVDQLKNALMLQEETIPDTVQTITFDSAGNVSAITHTANNVAVRTDAFTFGTDTITEVRTLSTGESLTIVTNTTTLQTTVTYAAA